MRYQLVLSGLLLAANARLYGQTADNGSITLYELPAYLGRSVTITTSSSNLATLGFDRRAQSARVVGAWTVCPQAAFQGACQTLTANVKILQLLGLGGKIASVRPRDTTPTASAVPPAASSVAATTAAPASTTAKVNLADLDVDEGTEGQDTAFFPRPSLQGNQIAASAVERTAADGFCKQAGYTSSIYASRGRTQISNLIDIAGATRMRAYPLRDVLCKR